eukprot:TRINITY_DN8311_c0_g1_i2.p2 TRINITY_DN8311_c0_g1~~TRINITY_DN8311_c0_g1_i2.p2  ORF type:complete len:287 (-),score=39.64 TRINITY_DN8311_c0_g1_i2:426-1286(-)
MFGMTVCGNRSMLAGSRYFVRRSKTVHFKPIFRRWSCQCQTNPQDKAESDKIDVSNVVVQPKFRSTPWKKQQQGDDDQVRILFVSESNVCRSVFAELFTKQLLKEYEMDNVIEVASKGSRDYNVGEGAENVVLEVTKEFGLDASTHVARKFDAEADIVSSDLVLVMDKFTAADVLREVTVYDTIDKEGGYSKKVRKLGGFVQGKESSLDENDIDDPLYGNIGGDVEKEAVRTTAKTIRIECISLVQFLFSLKEKGNGQENLKNSLKEVITSREMLEWLVPPMLQSR